MIKDSLAVAPGDPVLAFALADIVENFSDVSIVDPAGFTLPFVAAQAAILADQEKNVSVYSSYTKYNQDLLEETASLHGFRVILFSISRSTGVSTFKSLINYMKMTWNVYRNRSKDGCLVLNFGVISVLDILMMLAYKKSQRFFICHNPIEHNSKRFVCGHFFRSIVSSRVILLSRYSKKVYRSVYPNFLSNKINQINHGNILALASAQLHLPTYLIFFGNIEEYKDVGFILELSKLLKDYKIKIYGKGASNIRAENCSFVDSGKVEINDGFLSNEGLDTLLRSDGIFILSHNHATQSGVLWLLKTYKCNFICTRIPGLTQDIPRKAVKYVSFAKGAKQEVKTVLENYLKNYANVHRLLD